MAYLVLREDRELIENALEGSKVVASLPGKAGQGHVCSSRIPEEHRIAFVQASANLDFVSRIWTVCSSTSARWVLSERCFMAGKWPVNK